VKAALTFGRADDLEDAKRLMTGARTLSEAQKKELADEDSDLSDVR
jgi:hypothetical protein